VLSGTTGVTDLAAVGLRKGMQRQLGLLGGIAPRFDTDFTRLARTELGDGAWIEHVPGWVAGQDTLFDRLQATTRWRHEKRPMYDRVVAVPRLIAVLPDDGDGDPILEAMRAALSARYHEAFSRISLALYRDGKDSVAFHGDTTARDLPQATVATVSLGEPRRLLLRPTRGGRSVASLLLGHGDLFVMGGSCQRTFRHAVPKVAAAGPRLAVMFRPIWTAPT
jgi:alkylated DNA repair dioxygenase AlkB